MTVSLGCHNPGTRLLLEILVACMAAITSIPMNLIILDYCTSVQYVKRM